MYKFDTDFIYIRPQQGMKAHFEHVLNGVYSKREGMYRFPKNARSLRELAEKVNFLAQDREFMYTLNRLEDYSKTLATKKTLVDVSGDQRLRPYQRVDVAYLSRLPSAGIFNEPRTGKTPTSIQLITEAGFGKTLIISPASLIWNWAKEFEKWSPSITVKVVAGTKKQRDQAIDAFKATVDPAVMIVSKDTWKGMIKDWVNYTFDAVFVDEAHYLRNYKTSQSKAVFATKAHRRFALTGTPTVKHAVDIWGILHFLYPKKFPSYWQFAERYFHVGEDYMGHPEVQGVKSHRKQEIQDLIFLLSVQRKRKDVMTWLPDKERTNFYVEMNVKQRKLYNQMVETFMATDDDVIIDTENVLSQLIRMRQLCLDPSLLEFDAPSAKTEALMEYLESANEPVVVMSMFTSYLNKLESTLKQSGFRVGMITGQMSNSDKQANADKFQNGQLDVLLCNIISAGTGFTLDKGETIIFMDKAWNPADNEQAEDRITPTTQEKNHKHSIITFVCQDSFDEDLNNLLDKKKSLTDVINEGGKDAIKRLLKGEK